MPTESCCIEKPRMSGGRRNLHVAAWAALAALGSSGVSADGVDPLLTAARSSKPLVDLRLRLENVEQDGFAEEADAVTLRARLGFETGKAWSTSLLAETELLWPLRDDYNSTTNGRTDVPIVNDPESYEINRLQLANTSIPDTTIIAGRQRVVLDDERFISRVGWRQNEQTFDAVHVINQSISKLTIDATYFNQVNRVLGKESALGRYHGDSYLANVGYQTPIGSLVGFGYWLDLEEAPRDSSQTFGMRLSGRKSVRALELAYLASYATQQDYAGNPLRYDDDFYVFELVGTLHEVSLGAGIETLDGDGVKGFATPLATIHKFLGWADKFLVTPPNGLEHRYATLGFARKGVGVLDTLGATLVYHRFDSSRVDIDYGSEIDLQLQARWHHVTGLIKYADYDAHAFATDTRKYWLQVEYAL
jgi:hypothetical protein